MYYYYLGPYQWDAANALFALPPNCRGAIDLGPLPAQAKPGADRPVGFFACDAPLNDSAFQRLGSGDCREISASAAVQDAFKALVGYRPNGDFLVNLVWDCLTAGSDPTGQDGPLPIVPGPGGWMDLHLAGHSRVLSAKFEWGRGDSRGGNYTAKLQKLLQRDLLAARLQAAAGKMVSPNFDAKGKQIGFAVDRDAHRRVLQAMLDKFGVTFNDLRPAGWPSSEGPLPHNTTFAENFNQADGSTVGPQLTWAEVIGGWSTVSNQLSLDSSTNCSIRAEADLSSADHSVQLTLKDITAANSCGLGVAARFAASAQTFYTQIAFPQFGVTQLFKMIAGTKTQLGGNASVSFSLPQPIYLQCQGSTLIGKYNNVQTFNLSDTAISGGLRGGCFGFFGSPGNHVYGDDFTESDLAAGGGLVITQLASGPRGYARGTWVRRSRA